MKKLHLCTLLLSVLVVLGGCGGDNTIATDDKEYFDSQSKCNGDCFPNGVAAGDVDQSSVVLWARSSFTGLVRFEYGRDPDFILPPDGVEDVEVVDPVPPNLYHIPAKVDITGLLAGTQYYYRVCRDSCSLAILDAGGFPQTILAGVAESEARGSFRTPYEDGKHGLRFGVSSCFRGDMKPFVSIKHVPKKNLDFFVALGDTTYADSDQTPIDSSESIRNRAIGLTAFREKNELVYSQLKDPTYYVDKEITDEPVDDNYFALARASTAFYVDIDDHEVVNDFAGGADPASQINTTECKRDIDLPGEENDVPAWGVCFCDGVSENPYDPGHPLYDPDWIKNCDRNFVNDTDLFKGALLAWHEYNPVREERYGLNKPPRTAGKYKLYRYRTFGKDAALFMLDTRSFRDEAELNPFARIKMLGKAQLDDLMDDLLDAENKGITWKFVMVPEPIQQLGVGVAKDRFEGYAYERSIILDHIQTEGIANVVFISGDIHANIVNNLTYRQGPLNLQHFSTAWDISTGPVAYSEPTGAKITEFLPGEPLLGADLQFQVVMDLKLTAQNLPLTGFGPETFIPPPLQQENRFVPATLVKGTYVAGHSYGWTEFEIHPETQKLRVTTWGIDWYLNPKNKNKGYTDDQLTDLLSQEPYVLQRFVVEPRNGPPRCGDDICAPVTEKCGGNDDTLLQCTSDCGKCGNGEVCGDDNMCQSGLCNLGFCMSPQPNGNPCGGDDACISGLCNLGFCMSPQPNGNACGGDDACISGLCNLGFCMSPQPNGNACNGHDACKSGLCDLGFCTALNSKNRFAPCVYDRACKSGNCTNALICGL